MGEKETNRYSMNVRWSIEDECFIALSSEWPGLSAFGPTREEAIKEAGIALEVFIKTAQVHKMNLPQPVLLDIRQGRSSKITPLPLVSCNMIEQKGESMKS